MWSHKDVNGKIGNMRKVVSWTVCPVSNDEAHERTIQSDKRIARVNLETGKVILSSGKGGHQGFMHLSAAMGAKEYDCPQDILDQLKDTETASGPVRLI